MKNLFKILGIAALIGVGVMVFRMLKQYREDSVFDLAPATGASGGQKRSISPELLSILADPADKGPIELITEGEGNEWLVNRRNGYRYPVEDGIPIMLLEEGEKNKDESLIQK
ncbi:MAG: hypothetical protein HGA19_02390 [Oscillochloris sp.]|nr:hypothetical protein [Oscillochloris sp.]